MDPNLEESLRNKRNHHGHWMDWGSLAIELAPGVVQARTFPDGYTIEGDSLTFYGSAQSPYDRHDGKIRVTLAGLEHEELFDHEEVKWIIKVDTQSVLWVNDTYRPR